MYKCLGAQIVGFVDLGHLGTGMVNLLSIFFFSALK